MNNVVKLVLVAAVIFVGYVGAMYGSAMMDDSALGHHITNVLGPNDPPDKIKQYIVTGAKKNNITLDLANVKLVYGKPTTGTGGIARRVAPVITVTKVTVTATVTYERKIAGLFTKKFTLTKSRTYDQRAEVKGSRY